MIPAGYLYKRVEREPSWLEPSPVREVCSVSGCVSGNHELFDPLFLPENNAKLADGPECFVRAAEHKGCGLDLAGHTLFYYEMLETEFDDEERRWRDIPPETLPRLEQGPERSMLLGYDVAVFNPSVCGIGCSPLSCNQIAKEVEVNEYCLFDTLSQAVEALDNGLFAHCEPGPYRIFSVYEVLLDLPVED